MGENYFFLILYYFLEPLFPLYNVENKKAKKIGLSRDGWRDEVETYSESRVYWVATAFLSALANTKTQNPNKGGKGGSLKDRADIRKASLSYL